jgi:hypothetical protein
MKKILKTGREICENIIFTLKLRHLGKGEENVGT